MRRPVFGALAVAAPARPWTDTTQSPDTRAERLPGTPA
jgi:hypothetical protein